MGNTAVGFVLCGLLALATSGCGSGERSAPGAGQQADAGRTKAKAAMRSKRGGRRGGWPPGGGGSGGPSVEVPKTPVVVTVAGRDDMEAFLDASSTLAAEDTVEVVSQATGVVVDIRVEEGDQVRKGQLLVRLDYEELELAEQRARADLGKLRADYERAQALSAERLISEQDYQQVRFDLERSELDWKQRSLELERTRITSPIAGTITERLVTRGQLVRENSPVFRVVDFASLVAPVFIPEKYLTNLRVGQRALIQPRGLGDTVVPGRVLRVSPVVDSQSGTVEVTVGLDRRHELRPGMFANVQLVLDTHHDTVVIPKKALVFEDERPFVFVVEQGQARRRGLTLGYEDAARVEILEGLEAGESVVLVGQAALKEGSEVEVQAADREAAPPEAADGKPGGENRDTAAARPPADR